MKDFIEKITNIDGINYDTITLNELNRNAKKDYYDIKYLGNEINDKGNLCMIFIINNCGVSFYKALILE